MRATLRVLVPLLGALGLLAWGATALLNHTARTWFERDVAMRARLAISGVRDALEHQAGSPDRRRLPALLEELARDERVMAAGACAEDGTTLARTRGYPERYRCEALADRLASAAQSPGLGTDFSDQLGEDQVHVSVLPITADRGPLGSVILVHDMSFVARRERAMRDFTLGVFSVVALLGSVMVLLLRRLSWRSWTRELRSMLGHGLLGHGLPWRMRPPSAEFHPLLADLRQRIAELASEQSPSAGGRWCAERLRQTLERSLHGEGVIVVANREPYIHARLPDGSIHVQHPASGLVTALEPVMRACSGTWIAHGSGSADRATVDRRDHVAVPPGESAYTLRRVWLSQEEELGYYYGFANEGLWPLCHVAHTRPTFRASDWRHYELVNRRFANAVREEADGPDPIVLVQDYHFALAPSLVRQVLPRATILTFWHVPWPNAEQFGICPWSGELLRGLLGSSILGFHTQLHCNNFLDAVDRYLEARIDREEQSVVLGGRTCLVRSYPISIEHPSRWVASAPPPTECRRDVAAELGLAPGTLIGLGVDRLDYTKGIEERLLAVERLLERSPHLRGRFTFVQLAAPSRTLIERYRALSDSVESLAQRINDRFATGDYRPIILLRSHHEPPAIFRYMRAADLCYVSSLHDGMNLVAKEFVAARDDERGVLLLSRFTGAARELTEALIVNPYDLEQASAAMATALAMAPAEQAQRMRALRTSVSDFNVYRWAGRMLLDAAQVRQRERLNRRLSMGLRAVREGEA